MGDGTDISSAFVIKRAQKTFGPTEALNIKARDGMAIRIPRGKTTAVLGRSGSGKSSLLSLLGLLEEPDRESRTDIVYHRPSANDDGAVPLEYTALSSADRAQLARDEFSTVLQDGHLIGHLTVRENVGLGMSLPGGSPSEVKRVSAQLVESLGLADKEMARPKELSGGEYQRVAVARGIAHGPRVVFADEPTGNLDTDTGEQALALLRCWRDQRPDENTLVLVSHDIGQAWHHADYFIVLQDHDLKCALTKDELGTPGQSAWRTALDIPEDATGIDALHRILVTSWAGQAAPDHAVEWDRQVRWWSRPVNMLSYAFRDLFPLKLRPFNGSVFLATLRDTVFSVLTLLSLGVLVGVMLLGVGVYAGVQRYVAAQQRRDVRSNRLVATVGASSAAGVINAETLEALRKELGDIESRPSLVHRLAQTVIPGWRSRAPSASAVEGIYGVAEVQLFVYTSDGGGVTALGTTMAPDSLLQGRLTHNGQPLSTALMPDYETEGIIAKEDWLRRLVNPADGASFPPKTVEIDYGGGGRGSTREELPILGVVDDLPDGSFLIGPGCWHKIRDGNWRPSYRLARLVPPAGSDVAALVEGVSKRAAEREIPVRVRLGKDPDRGACVELESPNEGGWRKQYWQNVIWENIANPVFVAAGHAVAWKQCVGLANPAAGATAIDSALDYWAAVIYLRELGSALQVAKTVENGRTGWLIDPYVVNLCILMDRTRQLSMLFSFVVGGCTVVLCAFNIFLLFYQTVLRKRHALGVLKGFGTPKRQITGLFVIEALYLSLAGALLGLAGAWSIGVAWLGEKLKEIFQVAWDQPLFFLPPRISIYVLGACVALCILITCLATFRTAGKTANQLLRQRD